jgi:hypothetical protein
VKAIAGGKVPFCTRAGTDQIFPMPAFCSVAHGSSLTVLYNKAFIRAKKTTGEQNDIVILQRLTD